MIDIVNGLRRIAEEGYRLAGDAADEIERLRASLEAAEKDVTLKERVIDALGSELNAVANERDELRAKIAESMACDAIDELIAERDELRAKIAAMEQQVPVSWQTRTRPAWNDGTWGAWRKCSEEYAEDIKKTPSLHDWLYEARALYALPGAKGE